MSNFSIVLMGLAVAILMLLGYASTRPDEFSVERRLRIAAPADKLWPLVGELRGFNRWNPYERRRLALCVGERQGRHRLCPNTKALLQ